MYAKRSTNKNPDFEDKRNSFKGIECFQRLTGLVPIQRPIVIITAIVKDCRNVVRPAAIEKS